MSRNITVTFADGSTHVYQNAPDEVTPDQVEARASKEFGKKVTALDGGRGTATAASPAADEPGMLAAAGAGLGKGFGQVVLNAQKYAGKGIEALGGGSGPTLSDLVAPGSGGNLVQRAGRWLQSDADAGLKKIEAENAPYKEAHPIVNGGAEFGGQMVATAPVGGLLAKGVSKVPGVASAAPNLLQSIRTAGMSAGNATGLVNPLVRAAGGAINGGVSAALVDPESAEAGAAIGAALPGGAKLLGIGGRAIGKAIRGGGVSPEVEALAKRAAQLGINIPADRLVNSKPLDAVASALNYVPFSGRAGTEAKMAEQLNVAASKLMGQNDPNINKALRQASAQLGAKFDQTLQSTGVQFDQTLLQDLSRVYNTAERELGSDALKPIASQIDELVQKGATGVIDGQAAYNIKRTLDRIGRQNTPTAYHALELKGVLMDALDRSLGAQGAADFALTRQQYGNMLALEKLAKNGAEGEISVARLANLKNINNPALQELADIAAQFVKAREGQHGAMQRAAVGAATAATAGPVGFATGAALGRGTNMALNSNALRRAVLGQPQPNALQLLANPRLSQFAYRSAPILAADQ
ncbi:MAG TPA: hypothetical protein VIN03_13825 [Roseateles sp.]